MGCHKNINYDKFPSQGAFYGVKCEVCFNYDTSRTLKGVIVRYDSEEPHVTIIMLEDGRHVLATECQYSTALGMK